LLSDIHFLNFRTIESFLLLAKAKMNSLSIVNSDPLLLYSIVIILFYILIQRLNKCTYVNCIESVEFVAPNRKFDKTNYFSVNQDSRLIGIK